MKPETAPSLRILVVDDDSIIAELLPALLHTLGHTARAVPSGEAALALLRSGAPVDAVLTDLRMPGLEGEALALQLAAVRPDATLLLGMSGAPALPGELACFDAFLQKPFTLADLKLALLEARQHARQRVQRRRRQHAALPARQRAVRPRAEAHTSLDTAVFARLARAMSAERLSQLYALTLSDVLERADHLRRLARSGNVAEMRREAHAIQGGCSMVGAAELAELAQLAGHTPPRLAARLDFAAACRRLRRSLRALQMELAGAGPSGRWTHAADL